MRRRAGSSFFFHEFGDLSGITYNVRTGNLVTGHQRRTKLPENAPIVEYCEAKDVVGTVGYGYIDAGSTRYGIRFVDWPGAKEKAANVSANNPAIQGEFTDDLEKLLAEIQEEQPQVFDNALLDELLKEVNGNGKQKEADTDEVIVTCKGPKEQKGLLARLKKQGYECRAK